MERADLMELIESHLTRIKWNGLDSRQLLKVCKILEEILEEEAKKGEVKGSLKKV